MYTCSFHHGTECVPVHNRREISAKEAHIDEEGIHFSWIDEDISDAYERIFGEALKEYNEKQKRNDRKIKSYLKNVRENPKLNAVYECIIQIGNEDKHPDEATCQEILKKYLYEFKEKNTSLEVIGAYYHADELGAPHLHLDYVPVSVGKERGLKLKNNLTEALKTLGYETKFKDILDENGDPKINQKTEKPYKTLYSAQMQFQENERNRLKEICETYELKIENPKRPPEEYSSSKQLREARNQRLENNAKSEKLEKLEKDLSDKLLKVEEAEKSVFQKKQIFEDAEKKTDELLKENNALKILPVFENLDISSSEKLKNKFPVEKKEKNYDYALRILKEVYNFALNNFNNLLEKYDKLSTTLKIVKQNNEVLKKENQDLKKNMNEKVIEEVKKIDLQVMKKAANFEKVQKMSKKELVAWYENKLYRGR
ncbi:MAG TPA: plasmid recombination protein [Candidatus Paceibacterota bacterium]|jgi:hypothetical protein|nr:plasmid recombination protein [Candidatus Paceibacterota bacterium]